MSTIRLVVPGITVFLFGAALIHAQNVDTPNVSGATDRPVLGQIFIGKRLHATSDSTPGLTAADACDLNADGEVNASDVQDGVDQVLKLTSCTDADLHLNNTCTVTDIQVIVTDIETGTCLVPNCKSPLTYPNTSWAPSTAPACPPTLPADPNPPSTNQDDGPIHPCMWVTDGSRFQAIVVTNVSGEEDLNANLYEGSTCDPNSMVDEVFYGEPVPFWGTSVYWLTHFWDEPATSAIWTVGNTTTPCIDYSKVSDCN